MSRLLAYGGGLGLALLVGAKGFGDPATDDSYPLSTYPMFARPRGQPVLHFMEGLDASGHALRLEPALIANQEVMQAAATVRRAVGSGERGMRGLCERVAKRVSTSTRCMGVMQVRIVTARFDPLRYFSANRQPESRAERLRCAVPGRP